MSALLAAEAHVEAGEVRPGLDAVEQFGFAPGAVGRGPLPAGGEKFLPGFHFVGHPAHAHVGDDDVEGAVGLRLERDAECVLAVGDLIDGNVAVLHRHAAGEQQDKEQGRAHGFGSDDKWVIQYLDIPFLAKGRTREGLDCWGLIRLAWAEQCGVALPLWLDGYRDTAPCAHTAAHLAACAEAFREIPPGSACPGDILLFRTGRHLSHVGLALAGGRMLHITAGIDSCTERYVSPRWLPRLVGVYRPEARHG